MKTHPARPPLWRRSIPPVAAFVLGLGVWPTAWAIGAGVVQTIVYWSVGFGLLVVVTSFARPDEDRPALAAIGWLVEAVAVAFFSAVLAFGVALATGDDLLCGSVKVDADAEDCF